MVSPEGETGCTGPAALPAGGVAVAGGSDLDLRGKYQTAWAARVVPGVEHAQP